MSCDRKETVSKFSDEELLEMVKQVLEDLDIPYENKSGGFQIGDKWFDPKIFL